MYFWIIYLIFGLCVGSLINMMVYRIPIILKLRNQPHLQFKSFNLCLPRSHCPRCGHIIAWYNNLPLLSYIFNKGRCAYCKTWISLRYPLIELSYTGLFCGFSLLHPELIKTIPVAWFIALIMIQIFIDLEYMILPDIINYLLLWSGLLINAFNIFCPLFDAVYGAAFGYLGLWGFYHCYEKLSGKRGFGYGDFKLFAGLGAWIGYTKLLSCLFLSAAIGLLYGIIFMLKTKQPSKDTPIPFGPALAISGLIMLSLPNHFLGF